MNNNELIQYIYSNDELFDDISSIWNIDHIESHIDDIRDYINQDRVIDKSTTKKYIVSLDDESVYQLCFAESIND